MTWLIAFLVKNVMVIGAIGATAAAISSVESAAINAIVLHEKITEKEEK